MKERPILFSELMVKAIREDRKTQTRRIMKIQPVLDRGSISILVPKPKGKAYLFASNTLESFMEGLKKSKIVCPYGEPGNRLWVRENFKVIDFSPSRDSGFEDDFDHATARVEYADGQTIDYPELLTGNPRIKGDTCQEEQAARFHKRGQVIPSIHMPRWASRITLEVVSVRIEPLQRMNQKAAVQEGIIELPATGRGVLVQGAQYFGNVWPSPKAAFQYLWDCLNGEGAWDKNPFVWVVEFKKVQP